MNITLNKNTAIYIQMIALRDDVPEATKAAELIDVAIAIEEDDFLNAIAEKRDTKNAKYLSHAQAWK